MKLGRFWQDPWPWGAELGVGLKLTGVPRSEREFLDFLHQESCNPIAARRILQALKQHGEKLTTVQASFNFARLGDEFERLGVRMEVVPPVEVVNDTRLDACALELCVGVEPDLSNLSPAELEEVNRRADQTGPLTADDIGPYAWMIKATEKV